MPIAAYKLITAPVEVEPDQYRIGYDTKTGSLHVMKGAITIAYLPPRESREIAENISALGKTEKQP
jgi:hypothetical protein